MPPTFVGKTTWEVECIFTKKDITFQSNTLNHLCKEKSIKICAIKLHFKSLTLIIFCIYRAPTGNVDLFLATLNNILKQFLLPKVTYIVCGDLNINLLKKSHDTSNFLSLMDSYNLTQVVDFPTRITITSETLIDTVFIDASIYDKTQIQPVINGTSDHDAQFLCLLKSNVTLQQKKFPKKIKIRLINEQNLKWFNLLLQEENWEQAYTASHVNEIFNKFHDTLLRNYEASFPKIYSNSNSKEKTWITKVIQISCAKKSELFRRCRDNTNNLQFKKHYKIYCKILKQVINEAKKQSFHKQIAASTNKIKTAWKIVKENSGNTCPEGSITKIKYGGTLLDNPKEIANSLINII